MDCHDLNKEEFKKAWERAMAERLPPSSMAKSKRFRTKLQQAQISLAEAKALLTVCADAAEANDLQGLSDRIREFLAREVAE